MVIISDFDRTVTYELSSLLSQVLSINRVRIGDISNWSREWRVNSVGWEFFDVLFLANIGLRVTIHTADSENTLVICAELSVILRLLFALAIRFFVEMYH